MAKTREPFSMPACSAGVLGITLSTRRPRRVFRRIAPEMYGGNDARRAKPLRPTFLNRESEARKIASVGETRRRATSISCVPRLIRYCATSAVSKKQLYGKGLPLIFMRASPTLIPARSAGEFG